MGEEPVADAPGVADTVREATVHVTHTLELLDRLLRLPPPDAEPRPLSLKENLRLVAALDALDDRKGRIVLRALPDADGVTVTVAWQSSTVKAPAGGTAAETGIAVAKALAERNGGRLTETRPDREAGFRLRLTRWTGHSA